MAKEKNTAPLDASADHFPEHGPTDESGREVLLSLRHVDINFGKGENIVRAVQDVSFDVYKGETFSLVGESGSGKTTIGRAVIRANTCSGGEILYKGVRISGKIPHSLDREIIRNIQMVFQDPAASLNERATVDYIISEGLYNFHLYDSEADRVRKVENMIEAVGLLPEHLTRYPHEFSGGQRQRVGLARAMVMEPEFVVADEPISALDVSIRAQILNLMNKFQAEQGTTYLFIAHDLTIVKYISDRIAVMYLGKMVELADAVPLGTDEYFNADMIGLAVEEEDGTPFGRLTDVLTTGANDVFVVESPEHGEVLIPAFKECIREVSVPEGRMKIRLMDGLI